MSPALFPRMRKQPKHAPSRAPADCFSVLFSSAGIEAGMALGLELNEARYVSLLENLIGESEHLQNNPPRFVPEEDK